MSILLLIYHSCYLFCRLAHFKVSPAQITLISFSDFSLVFETRQYLKTFKCTMSVIAPYKSFLGFLNY